jgi:hypothetical protein
MAANDEANGAGQNRATLTGCLLAGGDAGSYVLQLASAADLGTPGAPAGAPAGNWAEGRTFRVIADNDKDDLAQNLNKRVAINGYVENGTVGTSGTANNSAPTDTATANGTGATTGAGLGAGSANNSSGPDASNPTATSGNSASSMQTIRAESVKAVADQCPPSGTAPSLNQHSNER